MSNAISTADMKTKLVFANGDTDDIVKVELETIKESSSQTKHFAKQFSQDRAGMKAIFDYVKNGIKYKEDPSGIQWVKTPARLYHDKVGDCKSFTIFIASILYNLGLDYKIRFASYDRDKIVSHVYPIAIMPDGTEIIIDAVWGTFDSEKNYTFKKDYTMTQIFKLSGVGCNGDSIGKNGELRRKIRKWWDGKTINQVAVLCLYNFYPNPVKTDSPTYKKIAKAKKLTQFLIEESPLKRLNSLDEIKVGIKNKLGKYPEEIFAELLPEPAQIQVPVHDPNGATGRRGMNGTQNIGLVVATIAAITAAVGLAWEIIKYILEKNSGVDFQKSDAIPNLDEMQQDTVFLSQQETAAARENGYKAPSGALTDTSKNDDSENDKMMMYLGLAVVGYVVLSK